MATKLYTNRDWYMTWLTTTLTTKGGWAAGAPRVGHYSPTKENSSSGAFSVQSSTTVPFRRAMHMGVTPRLQAQTISGTINPLVFAYESGDYNCFLRCHVWVTVGDTNTVRGTLLNQFEDTANEFALGVGNQTAQRFSTAQSLTPVAAQDGDRIVIELGFIENIAGLGTFEIGGVVGSRYLNADATVGSTTITQNQYIEFSADLLFRPTSASNDSCAAATVVSTFPYSATVNTLDSATVNQPNKVGNCSNWGDDSLPVWWKITVPSGYILSIHTSGSAYSTIVSLWTGTCAALTHVFCRDSPTSGTPLVYGTTTGIDYYLLVNRDVYDGSVEATGPGGSVSVSISATLSAPHGCTTATTITTIPTTITALDTTTLGTDLTPVLSCATTQSHMKWFTYTPATSHRLYITAAGTTYNHAFALFTGACPSGPWTQLACRSGTVAAPARLSYAVTAGTTYRIAVCDRGTTGGSLSLFFGDSTALGFIHPGQVGAIEWEGNYFYHDCNGNPCFLQILQPITGNTLMTLRLFSVFACTSGTVLADILRLEAHNGFTLLPTPPLATFTVPSICSPSTYQGHYEAGQGQSIADWSTTYNGSFGMRFRLSSWDEVGEERLADGYLEVSWPQSNFGTHRYDNLMLGLGRVSSGGGADPSTWEGISFHPGWWTSRMYVRRLDAFCGWDPTASDLVWYRDFTAVPATNAELFAEAGGIYTRVSAYCTPVSAAGALPAAPRIDDEGRPTYIGLYDDPDPAPPYYSTHCPGGLRRIAPFPNYEPPEPPPPAVCPVDFLIDEDRFPV